MKYKLLFNSEDLSRRDTTDSGSVIHGLESVREWIEKNETELLETQCTLRSIQKAFPPRKGMRETTVQNNWEWALVDSIDILSITPVDQGEDVLESYKIRGVIIRPEYIQFMSIPDVPMYAAINKGALSAMEKASIGYDGKKIILRQGLNDVMDVLGDGTKSQAEPTKTFIELDAMGINVSILNAQSQIVGSVLLENYEGELRLCYWDTDDVEGEPTNVIVPDIRYDTIYENGVPISGLPD